MMEQADLLTPGMALDPLEPSACAHLVGLLELVFRPIGDHLRHQIATPLESRPNGASGGTPHVQRGVAQVVKACGQKRRHSP
jgi:hypothetical protein